jgi:alpha-L-rhamnosidase
MQWTFFATITGLCWGVTGMPAATPTHLRCEYLTNPLAVDTTRPRLSWVVVDERRATRQTAYRILAASTAEALEDDRGDLWDTGRVESAASIQIPYNGRPLTSAQQVYWKVRVWTNHGDGSAWSEPARFRVGLLEPADWKAEWIAHPRPVPHGELPARPSPMFRKTFTLDKPVRRAIATATARGVYELRLNGRRVGDHILAPEWTDYHERIQYQTYDVTDLLRPGDNAVGAVLGDGWYAGRIGISHIVKDGPLRGHYGKKLALLAQIDLEYDDGTTETIATDTTWKTTDDGPIRKACNLDGEVYDARKEIPGWDTAGFDDINWTPSVGLNSPGNARLVPQPDPPIRITEELPAVAITEPSPGVYVVDFGQILAGWCRLRVRGPAGTTVRLRHAEVLKLDGNIYRDNLRMKPLAHINPNLGARQEDLFILRGDGEETFEPHFTYHGFRYVELAGLPAKPALDSITARVFHSDTPPAGQFKCSSDLLNHLMRNIVWTLRDNLHGIPTDCPQRDERMGWSGDMLVFSQPACFLMDMAAFFKKWQRDLIDDQTSDGRFPDFAPHPFGPEERFSGTPAWGDVGVFVPWRQYVNYADTRILEESFDAARRWVDWIHKNNPDHLWKNVRGVPNDYGDWLNGDTLKLDGFPKGQAQIPKEVFATAFFQESAELVAKMARALGRDAEAKTYGTLAEDIREAFINAYVDPETARVEGHTQASYAIALQFGLLPGSLRRAAAKHMVQRIRDYNDHISTGFHTTVMLMTQLAAAGYTDEAYKLINNRTIPSWGYEVDHGATTIWERWDGWVEGRGYQDPGMNSFCHYAIGSVGEWMYRTILGINPDPAHPGYEHFTLRPEPGGGLTWARGSYDSIRGPIVSEWRLDGTTLSYRCEIPANTAATLWLPARAPDAVREGAQPAAKADGVRFVEMHGAFAVFELQSGTYELSAETE